MDSKTTTANTAATAAQSKLNIEESREKRINKLKSKYRDRGGIFQPATENPLIDILLSRDVTGRSPSKAAATRNKPRKSVATGRMGSSSPSRSRSKRRAISISEYEEEAEEDVPKKKPSRKFVTKAKAPAKRSSKKVSQSSDDEIVTARKRPSSNSRKSTAKKGKTSSKPTDLEGSSKPFKTSKANEKSKRLEDIPEEVEPDSDTARTQSRRHEKPDASSSTLASKAKRKHDAEEMDGSPPPKRKKADSSSTPVSNSAKGKGKEAKPLTVVKKARGRPPKKKILDEPDALEHEDEQQEDKPLTREKHATASSKTRDEVLDKRKRVASKADDSDDDDKPLVRKGRATNSKGSSSSKRKVVDDDVREDDESAHIPAKKRVTHSRKPTKPEALSDGDEEDSEPSRQSKTGSKSKPAPRTRVDKSTKSQNRDVDEDIEANARKATGTKPKEKVYMNAKPDKPLTERATNRSEPGEFRDMKPKLKPKASVNTLKENVDQDRKTTARPKLKFPRATTPPHLSRTGLQFSSPVKVLDSDDDPIDMLS